ncbi:hypothetical protein [Pectobacterium brasiliense]|uniref:hypothetical protein n=1 Tax=Pectobacterium brasiliense TaxID=180957 RepID=UPI000D4A1ACF|nr:hypothetical protein [Pectobacterium brasiliense]PPE64199.1 hypothetical protein F152LOC_00989 [Pectobacterium brasiliense]
MKRPPFYRRGGRNSQNKGMKEKIIWQLQKHGRPMTGNELAEIFKMGLGEFNKIAKRIDERSTIVLVKVSKITNNSEMDFLYEMESKPKLSIPKRQGMSQIRVSYKSFATSSCLSKIKHIAEAKQRRELIARGEYVSG